MSDTQTQNPHWVGDEPAWDIVLSNGEVRKSVTERDIRCALNDLYLAGEIEYHDLYIDVVRQFQIDLYDKHETGRTGATQ